MLYNFRSTHLSVISTFALIFLLSVSACSTEDDVDPNDTPGDVDISDDTGPDDTGPDDTGPDDTGPDDADAAEYDADVPDDPPPSEPGELDLLWMIDNSGSMCQSQSLLREALDDVAAELDERDVDFHIGVTTSHMMRSCDYYMDEYSGDHPYTWWACNFEPVAVAGHLQATPQPIPGPDWRCIHPVDPDTAEPVEEELTPLLDSMETAFGCLEDPDEWEHLWEFGADMQWESEEQWELELRCNLTGQPGVDPDECTDVDTSFEDFFPDPDADPYRDIPLVLRSEDYEDGDGKLDVEALRDDLACMSLVGTRGHGFERGLDAVNLAISPEMTGGPDATADDRDEYPNAGFLRPEADTGLVFISNSNDCSHDGDLDEMNACGVHECTIQEHRLEQGLDSHLTPIEDLYSEFMLNLAQSRADIDVGDADHIGELDDATRDEVDELADTVRALSIHGHIQDLDDLVEAIPDDELPIECPDEPVDWTEEGFHWEVPVSCSTEMGRAWSGHRYSQFLQQFNHHFPATEADGYIPGNICMPFGDTITEVAEFYQPESSDDE